MSVSPHFAHSTFWSICFLLFVLFCWNYTIGATWKHQNSKFPQRSNTNVFKQIDLEMNVKAKKIKNQSEDYSGFPANYCFNKTGNWVFVYCLVRVSFCLHLATKITPITVYHLFLKGQRCYWLHCLVSNPRNQQHLFCLTFRSDVVFDILQMGVSLIRQPVEMHDYFSPVKTSGETIFFAWLWIEINIMFLWFFCFLVLSNSVLNCSVCAYVSAASCRISMVTTSFSMCWSMADQRTRAR